MLVGYVQLFFVLSNRYVIDVGELLSKASCANLFQLYLQVFMIVKRDLLRKNSRVSITAVLCIVLKNYLR